MLTDLGFGSDEERVYRLLVSSTVSLKVEAEDSAGGKVTQLLTTPIGCAVTEPVLSTVGTEPKRPSEHQS